jgi:hypothetical protein
MERNPGALTPEPGADRVWILVAGRPRLLPRRILEFWDDPLLPTRADQLRALLDGN